MKFSDYQERTHETAVYPDDDSRVAVLYLVSGLTGEAGEVANKVKKLVRDQKGVAFVDDVQALKKEMGDVLWYLSEIASFFGIELDEAAELNLAKLKSRAERGTLQGSGDNR